MLLPLCHERVERTAFALVRNPAPRYAPEPHTWYKERSVVGLVPDSTATRAQLFALCGG